MSLASVDGLVIALLFVLPGALGVGLRTYLWAGKDLSTFDQVLLSVAYSTGSLLLIEAFAGAIGLLPRIDWRMVRF